MNADPDEFWQVCVYGGPWVCYSTPNLTINPSSVKGVGTGAPQSQNFPTSPFPSFPCSLLLTALGVLRMLPVLQRLGDAYGP